MPNVSGVMREVAVLTPSSYSVVDLLVSDPPSGAVVFDRLTPFERCYRLTVPQMREIAGFLLHKADSIERTETARTTQ